MNKYKNILASNNYVLTDYTYVRYSSFPRSHEQLKMRGKIFYTFRLEKIIIGPIIKH